MLAKMTISQAQRDVLRRAVLGDLPKVDAVLDAYDDVDQQRAHDLHDRFTQELRLLDALGWREDLPTSTYELYYCDGRLVHALATIYDRAWIALRDHLNASRSSLRLLTVAGELLHQVAGASTPQVQPEVAELGFARELLRNWQHTIVVQPDDASPLALALRAARGRAETALKIKTFPTPAAREETERQCAAIERLLADLDPSNLTSNLTTGYFKLTAAYVAISQTTRHLSLRICAQLRGQAAFVQVDRPLVAKALDTLETAITIFDRFVQNAADHDDPREQTDNDPKHSDDDSPQPTGDSDAPPPSGDTAPGPADRDEGFGSIA